MQHYSEYNDPHIRTILYMKEVEVIEICESNYKLPIIKNVL